MCPVRPSQEFPVPSQRRRCLTACVCETPGLHTRARPPCLQPHHSDLTLRNVFSPCLQPHHNALTLRNVFSQKSKSLTPSLFATSSPRVPSRSPRIRATSWVSPSTLRTRPSRPRSASRAGSRSSSARECHCASPAPEPPRHVAHACREQLWDSPVTVGGTALVAHACFEQLWGSPVIVGGVPALSSFGAAL